ncbi:hypothetical protein ACFV2Q_27690 [Streptomyces sp. NPDC059650]|uniref:hypothetical protein n=1 Tax=Streptomyces sp. NPDC059650 TaxID=3346896 RepID=UPI00369A3E28
MNSGPDTEAFPGDLIALQQRWTSLFNRLVRDRPAGTTGREQRQALLRLSLRVDSHPYWGDAWSMARRYALQQAAAATAGGEAQLITRYVDGHFVIEDPSEHGPFSAPQG